MYLNGIGRTGRWVLSLSAAVCLSLPVVGAPTPVTDTERANSNIVAAFMKSWEIDPPSVAASKLGSFLADDCVIRLTLNRPPIIGKQDAIAQFGKLFSGKLHFKINVIETFSRESVVTVWRKDLTLETGKPDVFTPVVGVFFLKDGKIKEWTDYLE